MKYTYAIMMDDKLDSRAFANYKNARDYMERKAKQMNTYDRLDPIIEDYSAEYFYKPKHDLNDPFKSGFIRIMPLNVYDEEEK